MGKKVAKKRDDTKEIDWMFEEDPEDHPFVDEMVRWYLTARCPHKEQNLDAGILHHARDCADCSQEQNIKYMVIIRDLLRPMVRHCHIKS